MLSELKAKIRALCEDFSNSGFEVFEYKTINIFTIAQTNITITEVLLNGNITADYTFDSATNKITITASGLGTEDKIEVDYTFNKYSDSVLIEWVRASLVWISIYSYNEGDFEIETDEEIYPTPSNETEDLISLIASILIKPDYSEYRLPNLTVKYMKKMTREERIEKLITRFNRGLGAIGLIEL